MEKEEYRSDRKEMEMGKMTTYVVKREFKNKVEINSVLERLVRSHIK